MYNYSELSNGIPVIFVEDKSASRVQVGLQVLAGFAHDKDKRGLAQATLKNIMAAPFQGNVVDHKHLQYFRSFELYTFISEQFVHFQMEFSPENYAVPVECLGALVGKSNITKESFDAVKIDLLIDAPSHIEIGLGRLFSGAQKSMYNRHFNNLAKKGHYKDNLGLTFADVTQLYETLYNADNMAIVVKGDFELDKYLEIFEKELGHLENRGRVEIPKFPFHASCSNDFLKTDKVAFCLDFQAANVFDNDVAPYLALSEFFGIEKDSYLSGMLKSRTDKDYRIATYLNSMPADATLQIYGAIESQDTDIVFEAIKDTLHDFVRHGEPNSFISNKLSEKFNKNSSKFIYPYLNPCVSIANKLLVQNKVDVEDYREQHILNMQSIDMQDKVEIMLNRPFNVYTYGDGFYVPGHDVLKNAFKL